MKASIPARIQAAFGVALVSLVLLTSLASWSARRYSEAFRSVVRTHEVLTQLDAVLQEMLNVETATRGFAISGDALFLEPFDSALSSLPAHLETLQQLLRDSPSQTRSLQELKSLLEQKIQHARRVIELRQNGDTQQALELIRSGEGKELMDALREGLAEIQERERQQLQQRWAAAELSGRRARAAGLIGGGLATVFVVLSGVLVRRYFQQRRRAEEERDRFFDLSLDLLCIADVNGYFKRVNPAFTTVLGWSAEQLLARPFLDLVHPDDRAATLEQIEQLKHGKPVLDFENRYQCAEGRWKWLAWRTRPQPDGTLYAVARDVTELHEAREALRRSEENLAITLQSIGDAVIATDAEQRVVRLNAVAEQLTGWTQAEALGRPIGEVFRIINEHTRQPAKIPVERVLAQGVVQGLANHTVLIARDGTERPIADSAAPIRDRSGRVVGVVLVFRDVTRERAAEQALRESEQRLRTLNAELERRAEERAAALIETERLARAALDALAAAVVVLDEQGRILAINRAWQQWLAREGLPAAAAGPGVNLLESSPPLPGLAGPVAPRLIEGLRDVLEGRKTEFAIEYESDTRDAAQKRWFQWPTWSDNCCCSRAGPRANACRSSPRACSERWNASFAPASRRTFGWNCRPTRTCPR